MKTRASQENGLLDEYTLQSGRDLGVRVLLLGEPLLGSQISSISLTLPFS